MTKEESMTLPAPSASQKLLTASRLSDEEARLWNSVVHTYPDDKLKQIFAFGFYMGSYAEDRRRLDEILGVLK